MHRDLLFITEGRQVGMWVMKLRHKCIELGFFSLFLLKNSLSLCEKWMTQPSNVGCFKVKLVSWEKPWSWANLSTLGKHLLPHPSVVFLCLMSFCPFPVIDPFLTRWFCCGRSEGLKPVVRGRRFSNWWSHWSVQKMSRCGILQYGLVGTVVFSWRSWRFFASLVPP